MLASIATCLLIAPQGTEPTVVPREELTTYEAPVVALAADADGVHLGARSIPIAAARRIGEALLRRLDGQGAASLVVSGGTSPRANPGSGVSQGAASSR